MLRQLCAESDGRIACSAHAGATCATIEQAEGAWRGCSPIHENTTTPNSVMSVTIEMTAATAIPVLFFVLNWKIRELRGYAHSAAADFALAIAAFDLAMIAANQSFEQIVPDPTFRANFVLILIISLCLTIIIWSTILLPIENTMAKLFDHNNCTYIHGRPVGYFLLSWSLIGMIFSAHVFVFIYGAIT